MQAAIKGISIFLFVHYLNMHTCRKQLHTYYIQCAHSPRGSLMPEVRAAPTPLHANTTCCHSNRDKRWICTPPSSSLPYFLFQYFFFKIVFRPQILCSEIKREMGDEDKGMRGANRRGWCLHTDLCGPLLPTHP